jgi:uncharacterized repeat protein (TIGR03803 family)
MGKLNWGMRAYAVVVLCATTGIAVSAQTFTTLHSFDNTDGAYPYPALVQATDGNLYGTTNGGGVNGGGTIFKISPSGTLRTLYGFCSESGCTDGENPVGGLVQANNGDLYGTTTGGGANGGGTIFKISPGGTLTTLYSFCSKSGCTDGDYPNAALVQATDENLYGTTYEGGTKGGGTIFKISPGGMLTTLYSFCPQSGCTDGSYPVAALVQATDGNFYGTTSGPNFQGTVFKITPSGALTTLYSFCAQSGCTDGANPQAALVQATDGKFYGTTSLGGTNCASIGGCGTVFQISPSGTLTRLYSFCSQSGCTDGNSPFAGLVQATDGYLYGTTYAGGVKDDGMVFKIIPAGCSSQICTPTTLYSFCSRSGCTDGKTPVAALVQDTNGKFYGTTVAGGAKGPYGTVFSLSVGLGSFVEPVTYSGKVGNTIEFLGQGFTSATKVSFNGTAAIRKVVSGTYLTATVPNDATTGFVTVTTSGVTLKSNKIFRVIPQVTSFSPTSGPVGTSVVVTGESLEGATSVTFDGVEAKFTVESYTRIMATVPKGTKTGKIEVTTEGGTATSIGSFTVN